MTTPVSGTINLTDVFAELFISNSSREFPISLGDADVLALAGKTGLPISLYDLYGKTSVNTSGHNIATAPTGSYTATDADADMHGSRAAFTFYSNGVWGIDLSPSADAASSSKATGGCWVSAPTPGIGAKYSYTLTCTGDYTASTSGTLAKDLTVQVTAGGAWEHSNSQSTSVTLVITEIANPTNVKTITFSLTAYGVRITDL